MEHLSLTLKFEIPENGQPEDVVAQQFAECAAKASQMHGEMLFFGLARSGHRAVAQIAFKSAEGAQMYLDLVTTAMADVLEANANATLLCIG